MAERCKLPFAIDESVDTTTAVCCAVQSRLTFKAHFSGGVLGLSGNVFDELLFSEYLINAKNMNNE